MSEPSVLITRVQALIEALENSQVSEIELNEGGTRIQIKRAAAVTPTVLTPPPMPYPVGMLPGVPALPSFNTLASDGGHHAPAAGRRTTRPPVADTSVAVVSPLIGVYYSASSPSSDPFVAIGDAVQAGQVVAIVEAMKVFNEVKTEVSGTVVAMPAKNGQLVQKGDALVRIQPT